MLINRIGILGTRKNRLKSLQVMRPQTFSSDIICVIIHEHQSLILDLGVKFNPQLRF